jgi:hypothetical protein
MARRKLDEEALEILDQDAEIEYAELMERAEGIIRRYLQPLGINAALLLASYDPLTETCSDGVVWVGDINALKGVASNWLKS